MEIIIITILFCYIVYLQYQLYKKNKFIEMVVGKLTKLEQEWSDDHVVKLLQKLQHLNEPVAKRDKLFDKNVISYLFEGDKELRIFVHYTKEEPVARKIFEEGFRFVESFDKTAEPIINDTIDLTYKHNVKKYYGKFIVVICISDSIYSKYDNELKSIKKSNIQVEQVLTEAQPCVNENNDEVYFLSSQFIKGFVNYETGEIVDNPSFNPNFDSLIFKANLERLRSS
ncbi:MAG: hypothetical protein AB9846_01760 [Tenuifilaceae bacterium]